MLALCPLAQAAEPPSTLHNKSIRIVVAAPAGSAPDVVARLLGDKLQSRFGQPAIIDNRTGAGGIIAVNAAKGTPEDGRTLLLAQASVAVVTPLTYKEAKYDIERDFDAITALADTPMLFVANMESGPKSWSDAISTAKSQPDKLSLGNPFRTSIPHLAGELVGQRTGARFLHVAMSTTGQGIQGVISGDTQMYVDGVAPLLPLVKSGRMRALAVTSERELPGLEGIPLARAQVPGLKVSGWFVLFAPKGTPKGVIDELNKAANEAMSAPDTVAKLRELGTYPMGGTPVDAAAFVRSEKKTWEDVILQSGLKAE
jgi:tripartite-type tricarboxylate transporter receptor subunit TctC